MTPTKPIKRKPRSRRQPDDGGLELTPSRRKILRLLSRYRYLTAPLLALAYHHVEFVDPKTWEELPPKQRARLQKQYRIIGSPPPGLSPAVDTESARWGGQALSHVGTELGRLYHNGPRPDTGYVARHYQATRPTGEGSDRYIYTLTKAGARAILMPEQYAAERLLISRREERKRGNYDHHLALSTLQLILELGQQPWDVVGYRGDEHSRRLQVPLDGGLFPVQPDAWVTVEFPNRARALYLFEIDLSQHPGQRQDKRTRAYIELVSERQLAELKKNQGINNVVVVYVLPDEITMDLIAQRTVGIVRRVNGGRRLAPPFLFMNMESWFDAEKLKRSVPWPRAPQDILAEANVANLASTPDRPVRRQLVQSTG